MSGALSGVGQQQFPLSQGFQPGGTDATARQQRDIKSDTPAPIQSTEQAKEKLAEPLTARAPTNNEPQNNNAEDTSARRGSVINLVV